MKKFSLSIILVLFSIMLFSQTSASIKIIPFGINYYDVNSNIYTKKIISDGFLTFEPGIQLSFETYGNENTSIKFIQEVNKDQVGHLAGFSQVLIKYKLILDKKNSIIAGIGPVLHYRQTWTNIIGYQDEGIYKISNLTQLKTSWFSGEIEFNHYIRKKIDFSISLNHYHPRSLGIFFGYKYWLSRKSNHCQTCPSFH